MKKISRVFALCILFLLFGCQEEPSTEVAEATEVVVATSEATETAVPTATMSPTATTAPTDTAVPTVTLSPTTSPTPEPTATNTATPTLEPTATETATIVPTTAITAVPPPPPAAAPPPAPAPAGPNLLANPGFEFGSDFWRKPNGNTTFSFHTVDSEPQFVRSGQQSFLGLGRVWQNVSGEISPGTTYRAGGWLKLWSSTQNDRNVSVNPADMIGRICINTNGEDEMNLPTTICSGWASPYDVWQFISVDATATNDRITVILQVVLNNRNDAIHINAIWDDITLGLAPTTATATPEAAPQPVRPQPIGFNATDLRDSMNSVRSSIEQAGGLLDRLNNGEPGQCPEYQGYYDDAIRSAIYAGVPEDWAGIYNDYIFAVENFLATNENINSLCDDGGGFLSSLNYGIARAGINDSLNRLIPAVEAANAKLGG